MTNELSRHDQRCPECGRFTETDADGYYDRLDRSDDFSFVVIFCSKDCSDRFHNKRACEAVAS